MKIDHIGYAVRHIDRAIDAFKELGFDFDKIVNDTDRNVKLVFGEKDGYRIELVSPLDKEKASPVDQYVSGISGTPYHVCYSSNDFDKDLETLKSYGYKVIIEPKSAVAFDGSRVAFLMNIGFGLMEIMEK